LLHDGNIDELDVGYNCILKFFLSIDEH
jgi:hypothetical protein